MAAGIIVNWPNRPRKLSQKAQNRNRSLARRNSFAKFAGMTWEQILGLVLTLLVMGIGVIGSMLPGLPSTPLVLFAAVGHRLYFGAHGAPNWVLGILAVLTVFSLVMDCILTAFGAKKLGATWKGILGATIGGFAGLFFGLPGVLIGPLLGALSFELVSGRKLRDAFRAGVGATAGLLAGTIGRLACCLLMIGLFALSVLKRSL
jgi:uncharacterized protein YqgC (DUF456 family)